MRTMQFYINAIVHILAYNLIVINEIERKIWKLFPVSMKDIVK